MNIPTSIHDTKENPIAKTYQETTTGRCLRLAPQSPNQQTSLFSGDRVYLYSDTTYTGILIHPVERTFPPKWTVKLDRGGYEAVNIQHISITESSQDRSWSESFCDSEETDLIIPFSDVPETSTKPSPVIKKAQTPNQLEEKIKILEDTILQLEAEQEASKQQYRELQQEN